MSDRAYASNALLAALVDYLKSTQDKGVVSKIREAMVNDLDFAVKVGNGHYIAQLKDALADIPDPTRE